MIEGVSCVVCGEEVTERTKIKAVMFGLYLHELLTQHDYAGAQTLLNGAKLAGMERKVKYLEQRD